MPLGFPPPASVVLLWPGWGIGPGDLGSAPVRGATDGLMTVGMAGRFGRKRVLKKARYSYLQGTEAIAKGKLQWSCHLREKCPHPTRSLKPIRSSSLCPSYKLRCDPKAVSFPEEGTLKGSCCDFYLGAPTSSIHARGSEREWGLCFSGLKKLSQKTKNRHEERSWIWEQERG